MLLLSVLYCLFVVVITCLPCMGTFKYPCMGTQNPSKGCGEEMENCFCSTFPQKRGKKTVSLFSQILERNIMLLCNSESWWCRTLAGTLYYTIRISQEWNQRWVKCITVIEQSICFLFLSLPYLSFIHSILLSTFVSFSSPSTFSITSCLVLLHFPGVPTQVVASGLRPGPERSPQAFNGCIHNVRINGEPQDLSYRAAGVQPHGVEGKVITWGRFISGKSAIQHYIFIT